MKPSKLANVTDEVLKAAISTGKQLEGLGGNLPLQVSSGQQGENRIAIQAALYRVLWENLSARKYSGWNDAGMSPWNAFFIMIQYRYRKK